MFEGKVSQQINWKNRANNRWASKLICRPTNNMLLFFIFGKCQGNNARKVNCYCLFSARVSTKWLNLLRKICAIFAQFFLLRTFALFLRMKRNEFCPVFRYFFAQFAQNRKYFLQKVRMKRNFSFAQFFCEKPQVLRKM